MGTTSRITASATAIRTCSRSGTVHLIAFGMGSVPNHSRFIFRSRTTKRESFRTGSRNGYVFIGMTI